LGFIEYNGNLVVNSSLLSVVLHDQPQIRSEPDDTPPQGPDMAEE
jgi:CRP/FNR family transcriptional regulator, cyclic AMP receptor protein